MERGDIVKNSTIFVSSRWAGWETARYVIVEVAGSIVWTRVLVCDYDSNSTKQIVRGGVLVFSILDLVPIDVVESMYLCSVYDIDEILRMDRVGGKCKVL